MEEGLSHTLPVSEFCRGQVNLSQVSNQPEGKEEEYTRASLALNTKAAFSPGTNNAKKRKTQLLRPKIS